MVLSEFIISNVVRSDIPEIERIDELSFGEDGFSHKLIMFLLQNGVLFTKIQKMEIPEILGATIFDNPYSTIDPERKEYYTSEMGKKILDKEVRAISLHWMAIHPKFLRQKLGTILLKQNIKTLRDKGYEVIVLHSHTLESTQFYQSMGFRTLLY